MTRNEILQELMQAKTGFQAEWLREELIEFDEAVEEAKKIAAIKETDFHGNFVSMDTVEQEQIINPAHYKIIPAGNYPEGIEYMDLMTYILKHHKGVAAHLLGQIFKYGTRLGKKDDKLQDAKKIQWYADYLVKVIEQENE